MGGETRYRRGKMALLWCALVTCGGGVSGSEPPLPQPRPADHSEAVRWVEEGKGEAGPVVRRKRAGALPSVVASAPSADVGRRVVVAGEGQRGGVVEMAGGAEGLDGVPRFVYVPDAAPQDVRGGGGGAEKLPEGMALREAELLAEAVRRRNAQEIGVPMGLGDGEEVVGEIEGAAPVEALVVMGENEGEVLLVVEVGDLGEGVRVVLGEITEGLRGRLLPFFGEQDSPELREAAAGLLREAFGVERVVAEGERDGVVVFRVGGVR